MTAPCPACQGTGATVEYPCDTCRGSGIERRPREVKTRIPAGVKDGQTIRLSGRGAPGRNGGPAGDLLVQLKVMPHPRFGRKGDDLTVTVPVSFADAALGADIEVPTLDGGTVTLRIKPGTQSGSRHRVKGKGVTRTTSKGATTGSLIVTVDVVVPTELNDAQRAAVEALRSSNYGGTRAGVVMSKSELKAVYVISVAAELAGMHPQTLRIYERRGLVSPARTEGGNRRYSDDDIELLRRISELTDEGMNLEGIRRVMQLENENVQLRQELEHARQIALHAIREAEQADARGGGGDLVPLKQAVAIFGQRPSIFERD